MFSLLRYFSIASLVALMVATAVFGVVTRSTNVALIIEHGETYNVDLATALANSMWPRFSPYVASAFGLDGDQLRVRPETAEIHETLGELTRGLPILKVKIYDPEGLTVFSSDERQIGDDARQNLGFSSALSAGVPASRLARPGSFSAFSGEVYDRAIVETYVPVRRADGSVEAVLELYSDVTPLMSQMDAAQMTLLLSLLPVFGMLYAALFLIVRHADGILKGQYREVLASEAIVRREKQHAEAAARSRGEFLANMSHEIRTPMTAILGFAELLVEEDDTARARSRRVHAIETIRRNGEHLLDIINAILDLSKIEAGRLEPERFPFSPTALGEEVASLMRPRAEAKELALEFEIDGSVPAAAESDPTRIRQILLNLVGNAIKFTDSGRVGLTVGYRDQPGGAMLRFEVVDTGIGMSPHQIGDMFEAFTQGDTTTTRKYGGTGLGLTICRRLTALLGGTIEVESEPGEGSTFRVNLPVAVVDRARLTQEYGALPALEGRRTPDVPTRAQLRPGCRVLVAEDGPDNQTLIATILEAAGAEVDLAENGAIAVDKVREAQERGCPFDAVLMDMQMPVLDGRAAVVKLRGQGYDLPIIALTAHAMPGDRQKCLEAGCDDYTAKPIDRQRIIELIARHTGARPVSPG